MSINVCGPSKNTANLALLSTEHADIIAGQLWKTLTVLLIISRLGGGGRRILRGKSSTESDWTSAELRQMPDSDWMVLSEDWLLPPVWEFVLFPPDEPEGLLKFPFLTIEQIIDLCTLSSSANLHAEKLGCLRIVLFTINICRGSSSEGIEEVNFKKTKLSGCWS